MEKNIQNILFDFGGVIASLDKQRAFIRFRELGLSNIDEYLNEYRQKGIFLDYEDGNISAPRFYEEFRKLAHNPTLTDSEIDSGWLAFITGIQPYKFQLLSDLRKKYNVLLLSNTNPSVMKWAMSTHFSPENKPIDHYFDACYLSYQLGYTKPDRNIFELVIADSKINPAQTLFLDDGKANIEMASEMGFQTHLANQDEDLCAFFQTQKLI